MISASCVFEYRKQYPDDRCFFSEPGSFVIIENKGQNFINPPDEDDKTFIERLEKSKKHNHNYFYDEWNIFQYENGMIY